MRLEVPAMLAVDLVVVVVLARLLGLLARKVGQPPVIGEIVGGILLGPTLFHGAITTALFPTAVRPSLALLANVGVCVFMFFVGMHLDREHLIGKGRIATTVSLSAILVPFGAGVGLALVLAGGHAVPSRPAFVLFVGTAMAVTAFPVLARILTDNRLIDTPIGGLALACAATGDVLAWSLLAVVAAIAGGASAWQVLLVLPFTAFLLGVVRPLLARFAVWSDGAGLPASIALLVVLAAGLTGSAAATDAIGLHALFGAFLFGAVVPREGGIALRKHVLPRVERVGSGLLLPVFFVVAGLDVDLSTMDGRRLGELGLILLVAAGGKFGGSYLGARVSGVRPRHSVVLATLLNTRGLTELIALTVGLRLGVLDQELYSLLVVMALVTTAMTGVLLRWVYPEWRMRRDRGPDARAAPVEHGGETAAP